VREDSWQGPFLAGLTIEELIVMARPPVFPAEDKVRIVLSILAARLLAAIAGVCSWRSRAARGFSQMRRAARRGSTGKE
jgi:hypothetical protein